MSLTQLGSYANGSFAFSSWVSRGGDAFSKTAAGTFSGGFGESGTESGGGSGGESLAQAAGYDSSTQSDSESDSGSDSFVESGSDTGTDTDVSGSNFSDYEAGAYSPGSLSLSSVAYSQGGNDNWSEQDTASITQAEAETLTVSGTFRGADTSSYGGQSYSGGDSLGEGTTFSAPDIRHKGSAT